MTANEKKQIIESQYDLLRAYQYKANSQILYNLIQAKSLFELPNYNRSLYLDAKKFVEAYIKAADNLDYGYDEILIDKLKASVKSLKEKQQCSEIKNTLNNSSKSWLSNLLQNIKKIFCSKHNNPQIEEITKGLNEYITKIEKEVEKINQPKDNGKAQQ